MAARFGACTMSGVWRLAVGVLLLVAGLPRPLLAQRTSDWRFVIQEEQQTGSVVGNVKEKVGLNTKYPSDIASQLQFQFLTTPRANLLIENNTGIIRTGGRIDRDEICAFQRLCRVDLDIAVRPVEYFQILKVSVQINDINDNWPSFPERKITHRMLESTSPGSSFIVPAARDPDSPIFGIQRYALDHESSTFQLKMTNKLDGSTELRIYLRDQLDRESKSSYQFRIIAYDGDNPTKTGSMDLDIIVQDVNDNSPVFDNSTYTVTVLENLDTTITRVHATDLDEGANSKVLYGFSHQTSKMYGHIFGIDNTTGEIFVKTELDHEQGAMYHLVVTAQDGGQDSLTADATVIVQVQDINDHAPEISVNTLTAIGTEIAEVPEDVGVGTFVAHISVLDQDSGRNGEVVCSLHDSHFALRKMGTEEGKFQVVTADKLDRELVSEFNLALVCRDKGRETQKSIKDIQVKVTDVNDNYPVFSQDHYFVEIMENNAKDALLIQVNATDADIGRNGQIRYKLPRAMQEYFRIDPVRGAIFARYEMDREERNSEEFYVIAEDRGSPRLTSSAKVVIRLKDMNDEPPQFTQTSYSFSVPEDEEEGMEVGIVTAIDPDQFPNNQFTYSFKLPNIDADSFEIDEAMGKITTKENLDREVQTVYDLQVVAMDTNNSGLSGTAAVTVYITDKNDNPPVFTYPTEYNSTLHISNEFPIGKSVGKVHATDADLGDSAKITYTLLKGNTKNSFIFDSRLGDIRLNIELSEVKHRVYDLEIEARDHGSPPKSTKTTLKIIVNDTIAYYVAEARTSMLTGTNFVIIIIVASISFVVIVFLVAAIVLVVVRQRRDRHKHTTYANNMESMKMLHARDTMSTFTDGMSPKHQNPPGSPSSSCSEQMGGDVTMEMEDSEMEGSPKRWGQPHWSATIPDGRGGHTVVTEMLESPGGCPQRSNGSPLNQQRQQQAPPNVAHEGGGPDPRAMTASPGVHRPWVFPQQQRHLEVQQLLQMGADNDVDSNQSGDISNADSGRGASEEGDPLSRAGDVCPRCHSTIPRGTQLHSTVCPAHGAPHTLPQPPKRQQQQPVACKPPICCPSRFTTFNASSTPLSGGGGHPPDQMLLVKPPYPKPPRSSYATIREHDAPAAHSHSNANGYHGDSGSRTFPRGQQLQLQTFGHGINHGSPPSGSSSSSKSVVV